ncbi:hypothetical protein [Aquibacillus sediminis]|uniref:hypothetical protein n=1 Tax=Aquibacillus sediminis TaxID=2574734 RepID=UPI001107BE7D|nr:hypothetical protein [Aquibacillus sediminis]
MNRQFKNKTTLSPIVGIGLVILFSFLFIWIGENLLLEFIVKLDTMTIEFFQTIQSNFLDQWMLFITQF